MECEYLKRWFGSLTEQNHRLHREVEELRAMKVGPPMVTSASSLTMCPRCERVTTAASPSMVVPAKKTRLPQEREHWFMYFNYWIWFRSQRRSTYEPRQKFMITWISCIWYLEILCKYYYFNRKSILLNFVKKYK